MKVVLDMNIAICDDMEAHLTTTKEMIEEWSKLNNISINAQCFNNGDDLIAAHQENPSTLLFLILSCPFYLELI